MNNGLLEQIKYCPICNHSLIARDSLVVEYWQAKDTVYLCWCSECLWRGEIRGIKQVTISEVEED